MRHGLIFLLCFFLPLEALALPSFPGAEGAGAESVGGRGGTVCIVDTVSDTAEDGQTFRECVEASGARYVVFSVSGNIELDSVLTIDDPYITIAGQTSPGGIAVVGDSVRILTSNVIIQHMRFMDSQDDDLDSLYIGNGTNIIIDHCTIMWGSDETLQIGSYWGDISNVTVSWSIIANGLDNDNSHALGINNSYKFSYENMPEDITYHHNYVANYRYRIPQFVGPIGPIEWTNNVSYNWESRQSPRVAPVEYSTYGDVGEANNSNSVNWSDGAASDIGYVPFLNFTHNYVQPGPESNDPIPTAGSAELYLDHNSETPQARIYFTGNIGTTTETSDDVWRVSEPGNNTSFVSDAWRTDTAHGIEGIPVTPTTMTASYANTILSGVGATKPVRITEETTVINQFSDGTGGSATWTVSVTCPGVDCPSFSTPSAPTDSDSDGMADSWETSEFGDLDQTATTDFDSDGYDDLEEYLHYLAGYAAAVSQSTSQGFTGSGGSSQ